MRASIPTSPSTSVQHCWLRSRRQLLADDFIAFIVRMTLPTPSPPRASMLPTSSALRLPPSSCSPAADDCFASCCTTCAPERVALHTSSLTTASICAISNSADHARLSPPTRQSLPPTPSSAGAKSHRESQPPSTDGAGLVEIAVR